MNLRLLVHLHGRARLRKAVLLLERIERERKSDDDARAFLDELVVFLVSDGESGEEVRSAARAFAAECAGTEGDWLRAVNNLRHRLMALSGQPPADWDFIAIPRETAPGIAKRPGMRVYLEDIRSPYNVGSIFRTAEALGFEEVLLSPECADPVHPRAQRTAMGTIDRLPWRRLSLEELNRMEGVFALEVGGTPIGDYAFPFSGIMVLGSEELGVSRHALECCRSGKVSVPLVGTKASLNVASAFSIAAWAWLSYSPPADARHICS